MAKAVRTAGLSTHQVQLAKLLRAVSDRHGVWRVFQDFVALSAISISNAVDLAHAAEREAEYLLIVSRYSRDELSRMAEGLSMVVLGLESGFQDFLGALYMSLDLGDAWKGQFFTPYEVAYLKAAMILGDGATLRDEIAGKGFITVCDPCTGGGALLIAAAHAMHDAGINYQRHMHVTAADISIVAVHMSYIQLALLHIPAVVVHGNSLDPSSIWSTWHTPAHVLGFWNGKLSRVRADGEQHSVSAAPTIEPPAPVAAMPLQKDAPDAREQLALF